MNEAAMMFIAELCYTTYSICIYLKGKLFFRLCFVYGCICGAIDTVTWLHRCKYPAHFLRIIQRKIFTGGIYEIIAGEQMLHLLQ